MIIHIADISDVLWYKNLSEAEKERINRLIHTSLNKLGSYQYNIQHIYDLEYEMIEYFKQL